MVERAEVYSVEGFWRGDNASAAFLLFAEFSTTRARTLPERFTGGFLIDYSPIKLEPLGFFSSSRRYTRWVTRSVAIATIGAIWILAAFVSFVPISLGLHRPNEPLIIEVRDGKEYPTCALDLTPTYAVVSSCISFYVPCIVLVGIYCR
jgi:7 transmembrane receptor (rhodopsin family)